MLPEMSPLQFLAVQLLFTGPQSGKALRRAMKKAGVRMGPSALSRLMQRLEDAGYAEAEMDIDPSGSWPIRPRRFAVTDLGVAIWQRVRAFYVESAGPPAELVPVVTEEGALAHLPRQNRRARIRRRVGRQVRRMFSDR